MAIDKAKYHIDGALAAGLPPEAAGTHIGHFVTWLCLRNLLAKPVMAHPIAVRILKREATGRDLLLKGMEGVLAEDLLTDAGAAFARSYYMTPDGGLGQYIDDYSEILGRGVKSPYAVDPGWEAFDKLQPRLDERFAKSSGG